MHSLLIPTLDSRREQFRHIREKLAAQIRAAGNDFVGRSYHTPELLLPLRGGNSPGIVGIVAKHGVVKIEYQAARIEPQILELIARKQATLEQDHIKPPEFRVQKHRSWRASWNRGEAQRTSCVA